jgi:FkbM family methyltransferase
MNVFGRLSPNWRASQREQIRLSGMPRKQATTTNLYGASLRIPDAASFLVMKQEIIEREMYRLPDLSGPLRILDGGANIGLSVLFFKKLYPGSIITAFEPDPAIFRILKENVDAAGWKDVELVNKALWASDADLPFMPDGADAGRLLDQSTAGSSSVPAVRLRDYLKGPIHLLKLDIEGAEEVVLRDSADLLCNVRNIFVECHCFAGREQTLHNVLATLSQAGFRYYIEPVNHKRHPFLPVPSHLGMDFQANVFAFRQ